MSVASYIYCCLTKKLSRISHSPWYRLKVNAHSLLAERAVSVSTHACDCCRGLTSTGAAVAKLLAVRGVRLALNYGSNRERAEGTLMELAGSGHILVPGDAFAEDSVIAIVHKSIELLGGLDIVVSNAGWTKFGAFNDLRESLAWKSRYEPTLMPGSVPSADWMRCYEANVLSHLWIMQAAQEELKRNQGAFVISASVAGLNPGGSSMVRRPPSHPLCVKVLT